MQGVEQYLMELQAVLARTSQDDLQRVFDVLCTAYHRGSRIYFVGNGGSAATASHFVCDLTKNTAWANAPRFRAFALIDNAPLLTAWSNDTDYASALAQQVVGLVEPGDILVVISGSGNSPNVLQAAEMARSGGAIMVGFTGSSGGRLQDLTDVCVHVPTDWMPMIEDVHVVLMHALCQELSHMVHDVAAQSTLKDGAVTDKALQKGEGELLPAQAGVRPSVATMVKE